jgi:hypothetical protein
MMENHCLKLHELRQFNYAIIIQGIVVDIVDWVTQFDDRYQLYSDAYSYYQIVRLKNILLYALLVTFVCKNVWPAVEIN